MSNNYFRAAVLALALAVSACSENGVAGDKNADDKDAKAKAEASIPVEVATPIRGEMLAMYSGTATLEAEADAEIIAKVGGEVRRLLVEEGDHVKAGQVLAILDDRQLRLQAAQTRAALAKSRTRLQSPGRAAREGPGVRRRLRRPQVRSRQSPRRQRHRFA